MPYWNFQGSPIRTKPGTCCLIPRTLCLAVACSLKIRSGSLNFFVPLARFVPFLEEHPDPHIDIPHRRMRCFHTAGQCCVRCRSVCLKSLLSSMWCCFFLGVLTDSPGGFLRQDSLSKTTKKKTHTQMKASKSRFGLPEFEKLVLGYQISHTNNRCLVQAAANWVWQSIIKQVFISIYNIMFIQNDFLNGNSMLFSLDSFGIINMQICFLGTIRMN